MIAQIVTFVNKMGRSASRRGRFIPALKERGFHAQHVCKMGYYSLVPPRQVAGIVTEDQLYLVSGNTQLR
jgi:hypothetical protein